MKKLILITISCFLLSACNDEVKSVAYYSQHTEEAHSIIEKCSAGKLDGDNCVNAQTAIDKENSKKLISHLLR